MDSTTGTLPYLATNPRYIFFTDFDGTITEKDSNDYLVENLGFGPELLEAYNLEVLMGRRHFRDSFQEMVDSISAPFDECIEVLLDNITLDPHFTDFYSWCKAANVPVVVLSSGMQPIIRALLGKWLGEEEAGQIPIVSSNVRALPGKSINDENGWTIVYHDDSTFGHDKSLELRKYSQLPIGQRPYIFYAGDGVSDLSAAREADLMFAKAGKQLIEYCQKENITYLEFDSFKDIHSTVKGIVGKRCIFE